MVPVYVVLVSMLVYALAVWKNNPFVRLLAMTVLIISSLIVFATSLNLPNLAPETLSAGALALLIVPPLAVLIIRFFYLLFTTNGGGIVAPPPGVGMDSLLWGMSTGIISLTVLVLHWDTLLMVREGWAQFFWFSGYCAIAAMVILLFLGVEGAYRYARFYRAMIGVMTISTTVSLVINAITGVAGVLYINPLPIR
jgi:hypothetical protein